MGHCEKGRGHGTPKELNKTSAPHPYFYFISLFFFLKMQDLFVSDEGFKKLVCWLLGAQAA